MGTTLIPTHETIPAHPIGFPRPDSAIHVTATFYTLHLQSRLLQYTFHSSPQYHTNPLHPTPSPQSTSTIHNPQPTFHTTPPAPPHSSHHRRPPRPYRANGAAVMYFRYSARWRRLLRRRRRRRCGGNGVETGAVPPQPLPPSPPPSTAEGKGYANSEGWSTAPPVSGPWMVPVRSMSSRLVAAWRRCGAGRVYVSGSVVL